MALHSLALLVRDRARLNRLYGPQSLEEEISTEIAHAEAARRRQGGEPDMMDIASVTIGFLILLGAMTLGLHIATVMFGVGFIGAALYLGWPGANAHGGRLSRVDGRGRAAAAAAVHPARRDPGALRRDRPHVPLAGRLAQSAARRASAHQRGGIGACSRRCPGRRWRPRPPSPPSRCRRSGRRATTPAWSWARSPPAGRWAISSRPASP